MAERRYRHNDRAPRSGVIDIADELDVMEVGERAAVALIDADGRKFRILHTVMTAKDYWHD